MTPPLNGRDLLYNVYLQDKETCRQAIRNIQRQGDAEKRICTDASGNYKVPGMPVLDKIRFNYATQLSQTLFGSDAAKTEALMNFLKDKVNKKPPGDLPLPACWQKLFDKIVDPAKEMKSLTAKQSSQDVKDSDENQIYCLFARYNREIAQLNFRQLAMEIDDRDSRVSEFKTALRGWASSHQPEDARLQELLTITNFAQNFMDWKSELVQELLESHENQPIHAFKSQLSLLSQKLVAFLKEISTFRNSQGMDMNRFTALGREFPGLTALSDHDIAILVSDGLRYDIIAQRMAIEDEEDICVRILQRDTAPAADKLAKIP